MDSFDNITFTPSVLDAQQHYNGRAAPAPTASSSGEPARLSAEEIEFIRARNSFYMATVSETGWPYVQYRGGPVGFLHVLDEQTLAFADFRGNRQLLSVGNLAVNDRVALFLMDYAKRERLKILGHARVVDARVDVELAGGLAMPGYPGKIERAMVIQLVAFDWNCSQHISMPS